ncbi:hypothetical protein [Paenibacillus elgii]|uniref:hypothetical protein n=1 Tax=Paenibacillus elgii TaxID=189691 RepID=UPI00203F898F|nr:hypothetical protein [Paenibacillus elgii]MCM3273992.1 hypothetical protein [Paenibacillus elgii]
MGILKNIKCSYMKKRYRCNDEYIKDNQTALRVLPELIKLSDMKNEELKTRVLSANSLNELLSLNCSVPDLEIEPIDDLSPCLFEPSTCEDRYKNLRREVQELKKRWEKGRKKINQYEEVIQDIRWMHRFTTNYENFYFKVNFDKVDTFTCITYNLDSFEPDSISNPTLYLSFGKTNDQHSRMYISYSGYDGALKIDDFFSIKERRNHGSFMLQSLLELVPLLNQRIEEYNNWFFGELKGMHTWEEFQSSLSFQRPITYIYGSIHPAGEITKEDLVRFYDRNGFIKDGRLYRQI